MSPSPLTSQGRPLSPGLWAHGHCPSVKPMCPSVCPLSARPGRGRRTLPAPWRWCLCHTGGAEVCASGAGLPLARVLQLPSPWSAPTRSVTRATAQLSILRGGAMSKALQTWGPFPGLTGLMRQVGPLPSWFLPPLPLPSSQCRTDAPGALRGARCHAASSRSLNLTHLRSGPGWGSPPSVPAPLPETAWCEKNICFS